MIRTYDAYASSPSSDLGAGELLSPLLPAAPRLTRLGLFNRSLGTTGALKIAAVIRGSPRLRRLDLGRNALSPVALLLILDACRESVLQTLSLYGNPRLGPMIAARAEVWVMPTTLVELNLGAVCGAAPEEGNSRAEDPHDVPKALVRSMLHILAANPTLQILRLGNNGLTDGDLAPFSTLRAGRLIMLDLRDNAFTDGRQMLRIAFVAQGVVLDGNALNWGKWTTGHHDGHPARSTTTGRPYPVALSLDRTPLLASITDLPPALQAAAPHLRHLSIASCRLRNTPAVISALHALLFGLKSLQTLDISRNALRGGFDPGPGSQVRVLALGNPETCRSRALPRSPVRLAMVPHTVVLVDCNLRNIPIAALAEIAPRLRKLDLRRNRIAIVPDAFVAQCPQLVALHLDHNRINVLPRSIATARRLRDFTAAGNPLLGLPGISDPCRASWRNTALGNALARIATAAPCIPCPVAVVAEDLADLRRFLGRAATKNPKGLTSRHTEDSCDDAPLTTTHNERKQQRLKGAGEDTLLISRRHIYTPLRRYGRRRLSLLVQFFGVAIDDARSTFPSPRLAVASQSAAAVLILLKPGARAVHRMLRLMDAVEAATGPGAHAWAMLLGDHIDVATQKCLRALLLHRRLLGCKVWDPRSPPVRCLDAVFAKRGFGAPSAADRAAAAALREWAALSMRPDPIAARVLDQMLKVYQADRRQVLELAVGPGGVLAAGPHGHLSFWGFQATGVSETGAPDLWGTVAFEVLMEALREIGVWVGLVTADGHHPPHDRRPFLPWLEPPEAPEHAIPAPLALPLIRRTTLPILRGWHSAFAQILGHLRHRVDCESATAFHVRGGGSGRPPSETAAWFWVRRRQIFVGIQDAGGAAAVDDMVRVLDAANLLEESKTVLVLRWPTCESPPQTLALPGLCAFLKRAPTAMWPLIRAGAPDLVPPRELLAPAMAVRIDRNEMLGAGGVGCVFAATAFGAAAAAKTFERVEPSRHRIRCAMHELDVLQGLSHPCVPELLGIAFLEGEPVLLMEHVVGPRLDRCLRPPTRHGHPNDGTNPPPGVGAARDAARALAHLHDHDVLHGDIAATNLILVDRGGGAKLLDFSHAARRIRGLGIPWRPNEHLEYAAPEIRAGQRASQAADCYAFGVLLKQIAESGGWPAHLVARAEKLAVACCQRQPANRPDMQQVLRDILSWREEEGG